MENKIFVVNNTFENRLHYLDVAKGLLIIMVVYSHIRWLSSSSIGVSSDEWALLNRFGFYLWVPFYMQCFFTITGFCTNFDKDFKSFLTSKIITLLFPMFVITFSFHWFICALFNSLLLYFFIKNKIKNLYAIAILMIVFSLLGSLLSAIEPLISIRKYYIFHTIGLVCFIFLGQLIKKYSNILLGAKVVIISAIIYLSVVVFSFIYDISLPGLYSEYNVDISQWGLHILLSVSGILSLLGLSKLINKNRVLEFLGRNSLVIFLVHFSIIPPICKLLIAYIDAYWSFFIVLILTLILSSLVSYILNFPQLSWLIGKLNMK